MGMQRHFLTGCASGIGRHLAGVLQARGDWVAACDLDLPTLRIIAREDGWDPERVHCFGFDVTDGAAWQRVWPEAVAALGHIDTLLNIAGVLDAAYVLDSDDALVDRTLDVNVKGVMFGTRVAADYMVHKGSGHIINIASIAGLVAAPGLSVYCASKFAVRAYTLAAALELRPRGVDVTVVCPASINTPMFQRQRDNDAAELFYSGLQILTLDDIEHAIVRRALGARPLEVHVPRGKARLSQFVNVFPSLASLFLPLYQWSGRRRMRRHRAQD